MCFIRKLFHCISSNKNNQSDLEYVYDDPSEHMLPILSGAASAFDGLHDCYILHFPKKLTEFNLAYKALIRAANYPNYQSKVNEYIQDCKKHNKEYMSRKEYSEYLKYLEPLKAFLQDPLHFDVEKEAYEILSKDILNYEERWETVISELKQKAAIRKRREYIDANINEILPIISRYNDLVDVLKEYQQKNKSLI